MDNIRHLKYIIKTDMYDRIDMMMRELDNLKNFSENNLLPYMNKFKCVKCDYKYEYNKKNKYALDYYKCKNAEKESVKLSKECISESCIKDDEIIELDLEGLKYHLYKTCANCNKDVLIIKSMETTFNVGGLYEIKKTFCDKRCCDEFVAKLI